MLVRRRPVCWHCSNPKFAQIGETMTERYDWQFWVVCIFGMISMGWTLRKIGLWRHLVICGLILATAGESFAQLSVGTATLHPAWQVRALNNAAAPRLTADLCDPQGEIYNAATGKWSLDAWNFANTSNVVTLYDQGTWCWGTCKVSRIYVENVNGYYSITPDTWGLFDVYWIYGDDELILVDPDDNEWTLPLAYQSGVNLFYFAAPGTDLLQVGQTLSTTALPQYNVQLSVIGELGNTGNTREPTTAPSRPASGTQDLPGWLQEFFDSAGTANPPRPHSSMNFFEELTGTTINDAGSITPPTSTEAATAVTDLLYELGIGYEGDTDTPVKTFAASAWGYDPDKNVLAIALKKIVNFATTYLSWLPAILAILLIWDTVVCCLCLLMWGLGADNSGVRRLSIGV